MQYKILGETLPVVLCSLEENERMITESGSMAWMSSNMRMDTSSNGGLGKAFGRMFSGEALFQNIYTAQGGPGEIAFASSLFQKRSFLASTDGVSLSVFFQKKFGAGLFGGEGFILQKVTGNGLAFAEFDGHVVEYELEAGQQIVVDSGYLAAMSTTCSMDIRTISGEGLFNTVITGPGHVWLQTMPALSVARSLQPYLVTSGG